MQLQTILAVAAMIGASGALPNVFPMRDFSLFPRRYMEPCEDGAGVCMTGVECGLQRGRSLGSCRLGTCCRLEKSCGDRITTNNTYFSSPDLVRSGTSCSVEVLKKWHVAGVCQMRLDFVEFETVGPNFGTGMCLYDSFTVTGASQQVPVICGRNNKQHMYIDVRNSRSIQLTMNLGQNATSRQWRIRVTQIPCYSERLAPRGCLQYFEEDSGMIASFNRGNIHNDTSYPLNLRYQMCFRQPCTMQLSQLGSFGLGKKAQGNVNPAERVGDLTDIDNFCFDPKNPNNYDGQKAYLSIDGIRFCGDRFVRLYETRREITSIEFSSPIREEGRNNQDANAPYPGFELQYRQNCGRIFS